MQIIDSGFWLEVPKSLLSDGGLRPEESNYEPILCLAFAGG